MKTNVAVPDIPRLTHEGATAPRISKYEELRRSVLTCLLWENTFYEKGSEIGARIAALVAEIDPTKVAALAIEARDRMQLRHVPLFLVRELARRKGCGTLVENTLAHVIQRADELAEYCSLYWRDGRQGLSAGSKRGLATAFQKFDAYRLAKYNRDAAVKLRDVLFLCHAKPKDAEQDALWKRLIAGTLESPDTWEVELSAGKDKKATFERLMREGKLGGLAALRNLRNMEQAGCDEALIRERLAQGINRALPFRFLSAARHAPRFEDALDAAMEKAMEGLDTLPGRTGILIDVSGSMGSSVSGKSEISRKDAAAGLAIFLRARCEGVEVAAFGTNCKVIAPRRGFPLRDAIEQAQEYCGHSTQTGVALRQLYSLAPWKSLDRLVVVTDEQSHDSIPAAWTRHAYFINVAPYKNGIGYGNGWTNISGWSERIIDYIAESEAA